MPVEFLSDEQAGAHGRYAGAPTRAELDRFFFLDNQARGLIERKRRPHNKLGFALQVTTVHYLGTFLADPTDVPTEVVDYLSAQLGIVDPSCLKAYREREMTRLEHAREIRDVYGFTDFSTAEAELAAWVDAQAWTSGDGPKALFDGSVLWLREHKVLLPGVSTLTRLVARVRDEATQRLWDALAACPTALQRRALEGLVVVADGVRDSDLERLRRGPTRVSGAGLTKALGRVAEIAAVGASEVDLSGFPPRRVADLARYGLAAKANLLRRHPPSRRLATLLATVTHLEAHAVDDALELFDVLMATDLLSRAAKESDKEKLRRVARLDRASVQLAAAVGVLFETDAEKDPPSLPELWERIEARVSRDELAAAMVTVTEAAPPPGADPAEEWREELVGRFRTVRPFLPLLADVIAFGATPEGTPVLAALRNLPELLRRGNRARAGDIDPGIITGPWKRLVLGAGGGFVDVQAYVFCVLEQFHRHLRRRDVYAKRSFRWGDPRAKLLAGEAWEASKATVLRALQLPEEPDELLAGHAQALDEAYREVAARLPENTAVSFDEDGRLHLGAIRAEPDPASLVELRKRVKAMLPRVDLPEIVLEVMSWVPEFTGAFTPLSGGEARLDDLHITIAAVLCAHALNIDFTPVVRADVPALTPERISHVDQNYFGMEAYAAAGAALVSAQAEIGLAQAWGGGFVASVDGMRFVVPVVSIHARPNPRYFGRGRGATWLNAVNDQAAGIAGMVVAGTPRDSLHMIDVLYSQQGEPKPEVIITDTASYSDIVFGLVHLLRRQYRPQLADLPDQKLWRGDPTADYGLLNPVARGRINLAQIHRHWPDIVRVAASIHTGAVRAYDVIRMIQRDGNPTPLGNAIAHYGRIFKSLHILRVIDEPDYRRQMKAQGNLQEGRHSLGRHIFHARRGELRQRYHEGMEDQLGAFGLVLNCVTLWNTFYSDAALDQLRRDGHPVRDEDVARLSPFPRKHINVQGRYSFVLPELPGGRRPLRDPDDADDDEE